ncbi:hypothetical protein AeMF1_007045, partial [Aphanomyces euteiches]
MKALERDDQTWVLEQEGKIVVDIMVKAIKPTTLQKSVVRQLAMNRNKPLKSDVFRFVEWLRVHTAGYQLYAPVDEEKPPAPPKNAKIEKSNDSGGGGADRGPPANEQPTRCHASKTKTQCAPGEADRLLKEQLEKWEDARKKVAKLNQPVHQSLGREAKIEDTVSVSTTLLDTGSDVTLVTASVINSLEDAGVSVETVSCDAIEIQPYGQTAALKVDRQVQFKLVTLETPCGPLALRGLKAWVDSTTDAAELLISRAVMERLGFSEDDFLSHAYTKQEVWDVSDVDKPSDFARINRLTQAAVPDECGDDGLSGATPDIQVPPPELSNAERGRRQAVVEAVLEEKLQESERQGLSLVFLERLRKILTTHVDVFRLEIGHDKPIAVEPLGVRIKPGAIPVKCGLRRYPPAYVEILKQHVRELEAAGLVYRNNRATWASAPRIVPKKDPNDLRMTIDSRPINACTEPMPWPMPNLDAALTVLVGSRVFFTLDWFKGYWQLALHEDSQMYYSFMTPFGVYTPTRVLMGQTDAVAFCQSSVDFMFADLLFKGLLAWLDDMLGYAETTDDLFDLLEQ